MKKSIVFAVLVLSVLTVYSTAATLTDNFDNGISVNWGTFQTDAAGAPWTVSASTGALEISKSADNDVATMYQHLMAGVQSNFALDGNFSVSVDFSLPTFPLVSAYGWNETMLKIRFDQGGEFYSLRFTNNSENRAEAFCNIDPYVIGYIPNSTTQGKFTVSRQGTTMSAYLNDGINDIFLGQMSSQQFSGNAVIQLYAAQAWDYPGQRPNTALDVRFDNFTATADSIVVPEPMSMFLFGIGGLMLRIRKK